MTEDYKSFSGMSSREDNHLTWVYKVSLVRELVDHWVQSGRLSPSIDLIDDVCNSVAINEEELYQIITEYCQEIGQPVQIGGEDI